MNEFLKLVEDSQVLKHIRKMVPPDRLKEYDEFVKSKLLEENQSYLTFIDRLNSIKEEISNATEPKTQPRQSDVPSNE